MSACDCKAGWQTVLQSIPRTLLFPSLDCVLPCCQQQERVDSNKHCGMPVFTHVSKLRLRRSGNRNLQSCTTY